MRYPNLRYGTLDALLYYGSGIPRAELARRLRRSEKTIKRWEDGIERIPFWVPELLRLQQMEYELRCYQMGMGKYTRRNQPVLLEFPEPAASMLAPAEKAPRRLRLIVS